jgi:hypothetical protein
LKIEPIIPSFVALAIVGAWIGTQRQSIATIVEQSVVLRKQIATVRGSGGPGPAVAGRPSASKSANEKQPLDWKKIADEMAEMQRGGMGDIRSMIRLQQRLETMTSAELLTALDEIAALDLSTESRAMLEQMLFEPLLLKDPELALSRFVDRLTDGRNGMSYQLAGALTEWAKKDPSKAGAWLDQQIAAGKLDSKTLDGKSRGRMQFEGGMISVLLSSDPEAASRRMAALPEDQRLEVIRGYGIQNLKEDAHSAFADLVRKQLSENDQPAAISSLATHLVAIGGYDDVTSYLDRINATPTERAESVENAAGYKIRTKSHQGTVTREDIDSMREWVTAQSPDSVDRATGKALALGTPMGNGKGKGMTFSEAAELVQHYSDAGGGDEVIASFLERGGSSNNANKDEARVLANKITDPQRREKILQRLK